MGAIERGGLLVRAREADGALFETLFSALAAHNAAQAGPAAPVLVAFALEDGQGRVAGGIWGRTLYGWLAIQMLFVPPEARGRGLGRDLVRAAEAAAREGGAIGAMVDSFGFQAAGFYEALGYRKFGTLIDLPPGDCCHYLARRLDDAGCG